MVSCLFPDISCVGKWVHVIDKVNITRKTLNKHVKCIYMTAASVILKVNHSGQCEDLSNKTARCIGKNSKSKSGLLAKTSGVVAVSGILVYQIFFLRYRRCRSMLLSLNFFLDVKSRIYTIILT